METEVECHSGYRYAERPVALYWQSQRQEIAEVLAGWQSPEGRGFRVRTREGLVFELTYRELEDQWSIRPVAGG